MRVFQKWLTALTLFAGLTLLSPTPASAQGVITVLGNFQATAGATGLTLSGLAGVNFIRVRLRNFAGNLPRTSGGVIVGVNNDIVPDGSGNILLFLYGNDDISPAGTFYSIDFYINGRLSVSQNFAFCRAVATGGCSGFSSSVSLNTATPLSTIPVVAPGGGDSTYLRLDGGNSMTGSAILRAQYLVAREQSTPSSASGETDIWADSSTHRLQMINNAGAVQFVIGDTTADTLKSKTLIGTSDGNVINLLNFQGSLSPVTGNGADQTFYTYTLPGNFVGQGRGIRVYVWWTHSTGSSSYTTRLSFGGTSTTALGAAATAAARQGQVFEIFNVTTSSQILTSTGQDSSGSGGNTIDTAAVNTTSNVTINMTFNAAGTEAITPKLFYVERIQ